jgi:alpha-tubulin suppressor-like RCC1 family protein
MSVPPPHAAAAPASDADGDTASTRRGTPPFVFQVKGDNIHSSGGSSSSKRRHKDKHSVGITQDGVVYTWGPSSGFGQLGRPTGSTSGIGGDDSSSKQYEHSRTPAPAVFSGTSTDQNENLNHVHGYRAYAGGASDSGHTAVLDTTGNLWMTGCDRWQQLGLGSPAGGSAGYTWVGGKTHQTSFQKNEFITTLLTQHDATACIRDVALGGDHTVVLSSNQKDVFVFGKGGEGQLGLNEKRFVSAPARSQILSASSSKSQSPATTDVIAIASVCAIQNCSLTMDRNGKVLQTAGKCRETQDFVKALANCRERAEKSGLLIKDTQ